MRNQRHLLWPLILVLAVAIAACGSSPSTPRATRPPTPTFRPQPTRTQSITISACFNLIGLNVRSGPGVEHSDIGGLTNGQCVVLDGRNQDGSWVRIRTSNSASAPRGGWVSSDYLDSSGNFLDLLVVATRAIAASPVVRPPQSPPQPPQPAPPQVSDNNPTALCRDGTYSYSQHRRGTCSWHGGVAEWLRDDIPP